MLLLNAGTALPVAAAGEEARRIIWQPVQRYFIRRQGSEQPPQGKRRLNSFNAYTHLGTDFGFHGPAEHEIEWVTDEVKVHLGQQPDTWAGMWHSLAGQARHTDQVLDFARPFPAAIADLCQPRISQIMLEAGGHGALPTPPVHRASTWTLSLEWAQQGLGVALAHDTVARDLIAAGRLVRPVPFAMPMKEAYYLIAPEGSHINAAAQAFKVWLLREMLP